MTPRISFDLDGVVCDFMTAAIDAARLRFRPDIPKGYHTTNYDFTEIITAEQWHSTFQYLLDQDQFWTTLKPFQENVDAILEYCSAHGEEGIYFCTARTPCAGGSLASMTQLWLWEHRLPMQNLIIVEHSSDKKQVMIENGIDYSIDDLPKTIYQCNEILWHRAFLLDRSYNQEASCPRMKSVAEFLLEVELTAY